MLNNIPTAAAPSRGLKAGSLENNFAQGSLRFGLDPRVTYRTIFLEQGIDIVPCADTGRPLTHFLGNAEHLGRPIGIVPSWRVSAEEPVRKCEVNEIDHYDEQEAAGALPMEKPTGGNDEARAQGSAGFG